MDNLFILILAFAVFDIIVFTVYFIKGKSAGRNKIPRYLSLFVMVASIILVFCVFSYYEDELQSEINELRILRDSAGLKANKIDSLLTQQKGKEQLIDSLSNKTKELEEILHRVQRHEKITGKRTGTVPQVEEIIKETEKEIETAKTYNEILNPKDYWDYIKKGYSYTGNTTAFTFYPPYKTDVNYVDFSIRFNNETILDKIAVLYLEVCRKGDDGKIYMIYSAFYRPQTGLNNFKVHNYFLQKNITMTIGFFWKDELGKVEVPTYEKYSYRF